MDISDLHSPVYTCFHCKEEFITDEDAALHFGTSLAQVPACTIDAAEYRAMEERMRRYNEEDADIHREMHRMAGAHVTALKREEERGYAKGLEEAYKGYRICDCCQSYSPEKYVHASQVWEGANVCDRCVAEGKDVEERYQGQVP
jgi:hypothetical protein